jgi:hypothetical protein
MRGWLGPPRTPGPITVSSLVDVDRAEREFRLEPRLSPGLCWISSGL